jgi:hypothetical protein
VCSVKSARDALGLGDGKLCDGMYTWLLFMQRARARVSSCSITLLQANARCVTSLGACLCMSEPSVSDQSGVGSVHGRQRCCLLPVPRFLPRAVARMTAVLRVLLINIDGEIHSYLDFEEKGNLERELLPVAAMRSGGPRDARPLSRRNIEI